jgi:hypothetical protein
MLTCVSRREMLMSMLMFSCIASCAFNDNFTNPLSDGSFCWQRDNLIGAIPFIFEEFFLIAIDSFVLTKGVVNFSLKVGKKREKGDNSLQISLSLMPKQAFGSTETLVNISS